MAQRHLPKDSQTAKIKSLPEELRGIAEELVGAKFGYEEETVTKSGSTFRGYDEFSYFDGSVGIDMGFGSDKVFVQSTARAFGKSAHVDSQLGYREVRPGVEQRVDFYSRSCIFVTPITGATTRSFRDACQRLDYANAPQHKRKAVISDGMANELTRQPEFAQYAMRDERQRGSRDYYLATMFGVPIFVVPGGMSEMQAE